LNLHRRHINLGDTDVEPAIDIDALEPVGQVRITDRKPELILGQAQQNRIIEDMAFGVAQDDIATVHWLDAGNVTGADIITESFRIRAFDPDLALNRDIPQGDIVDNGFIFHHRTARL